MRTVFQPRLILCRDALAAAEQTAVHVAAALRGHQVLGLATGATMLPLYEALHEQLKDARLAGRGVVGIALDEYVGLAAGHRASFAAYLDRAFMMPLRLDNGQVVIPDGIAADRAGAAARHEAAIAAVGGIDLQLLGIGANGHIGFNEPGSALDSVTRDVTLAPDTRLAQAQAFGSLANVPYQAITAGIATILAARELLMLVTGEAKAVALTAALEGAIGPHCPASALRLHPNAVVICDVAAASLLQDRSLIEEISETC